MKGMAKKLLAVMLAAYMVFHPCIAAYAVDTQMPGESTENAVGIDELEITEPLSDTEGEATKEAGEQEQNEAVPVEETEEIEAEKESVKQTADVYKKAIDEGMTASPESFDDDFEDEGQIITDDQTINVTDGNYYNAITVKDSTRNACINVTGGYVEKINIKGQPQNLSLNISGGQVEFIVIEGDPVESEITISGGRTEQIHFLAMQTIPVTITGGEVSRIKVRTIILPFVYNVTKDDRVSLDPPFFVYRWESNGDGTSSLALNVPARIGQNYYTEMDQAFEAARDGDTIEILLPGTYTLPNIPYNITVEGKVDGVVFEHLKQLPVYFKQ